MPTSLKARRQILQMSEEVFFELNKNGGSKSNSKILELGSGWGGLARALAKKFPKAEIFAYEASPLPFSWCAFVQKIYPIKNLHFQQANFLSQPLPAANLVVTYLYPGGMEAIAKALKTQDIQTKYLISCAFALAEFKPSKCSKLDDWLKTPIYCYFFEGLGSPASSRERPTA